MVLGERAFAVQRGDHRDVRQLREQLQLPGRRGLNHSVAREDQRLLRVYQQRDRFANGRDLTVGACSVRRRRRRHGNIPLGFNTCLLRVLGDVDQHGSGPPAGRDVKRFPKHPRDLGGVAHQVAVLRDRNRDAGDVRLLESVGAQQSAGHLPGNRDEWRAVHPRVGDRRHQVRRAGAARRDAHSHAPARARIALGRMACPLLVPAQHVMQPVAIRVVRVIERHDRAPGDAEHHAHVLADERLAHDLRAGQHESTAP